MSQYEKVADLHEVPEFGRKSWLLADEVPVILVRLQEQYYCVEDVCSHDGQPLTNGPIDDRQITCPRHGAKFDLANGAPTCMPATEPIQTFNVEVREDGIYVACDL